MCCVSLVCMFGVFVFMCRVCVINGVCEWRVFCLWPFFVCVMCYVCVESVIFV